MIAVCSLDSFWLCNPVNASSPEAPSKGRRQSMATSPPLASMMPDMSTASGLSAGTGSCQFRLRNRLKRPCTRFPAGFCHCAVTLSRRSFRLVSSPPVRRITDAPKGGGSNTPSRSISRVSDLATLADSLRSGLPERTSAVIADRPP